MKKITLMLMFLLLGVEASFAQTYMLTKSILAKKVDINRLVAMGGVKILG